MTIKLLRTGTAVALVALACAPSKAPGASPGDMTPEEHQRAAEEERRKAAEHEQDKQNVPPSKPHTEWTEETQHEQEAERHRRYEEQHRRAAEADGGAKKK